MSKKFDVVVAGELNVDLIFNQIESFPETGKEKLAHNMTITLGSSSAIFANNLSSLDVKVGFIGVIGNDNFGNFCRKQLEEKGVDTSMLQVRDGLTTGATVVLNFNEDRANVTYQGAMKYLQISDITSEMMSSAKHFHFSSCFLQPGLINDLPELFRKAKEAGLTTSFDTQWDPAQKWELDYEKLLPYVDVFLPNECELLNLTRRTTVESAVEKIRDFANIVVIKLGNKGSLAVQNGEVSFEPAFLNESVVDAIGAGDSFNAGFIFKFIQNESIVNCQIFGNLMGAISTTAAGGTTAFSDKQTTIQFAKEKFGYRE